MTPHQGAPDLVKTPLSQSTHLQATPPVKSSDMQHQSQAIGRNTSSAQHHNSTSTLPAPGNYGVADRRPNWDQFANTFSPEQQMKPSQVDQIHRTQTWPASLSAWTTSPTVPQQPAISITSQAKALFSLNTSQVRTCQEPVPRSTFHRCQAVIFMHAGGMYVPDSQHIAAYGLQHLQVRRAVSDLHADRNLRTDCMLNSTAHIELLDVRMLPDALRRLCAVQLQFLVCNILQYSLLESNFLIGWFQSILGSFIGQTCCNHDESDMFWYKAQAFSPPVDQIHS